MIGDIEVEVLETLKNGVQEFSKKLVEEASQYSEFRTDLVKVAIALSLEKYRIMNPQELRGIKKSDIYTILFTYNCFHSTKAIIKLKNGQDRTISIMPIIDEEVQKMLELMKVQYNTLLKKFNERFEEKEKEIERKEDAFEDLKKYTIAKLIDHDDYDDLRRLLWFYGNIEDYKFIIELAKEKGKDPKAIVEIISDIEGIDPEVFKKEFEIEV